ncbi:hydrogenase small subunit [Dehalogenimonas etheniformans]|uniref:Ni,Fe-hydrogenase small subunit n=1 Tax=Dehalogenimonas etheniformans TaxID=1536648 RepID=A0A2P5P710_9CHLR|nr:hydrogenase small subunit [Dehalogenimonas etheniformans]PPD58083.1 Ni,Fe-hydrogenase small subunit [Dehalogenimonas etheniformans]QNT75266.1 hydrogenase small subunit [Dehalogenimonas etheniformans]
MDLSILTKQELNRRDFVKIAGMTVTYFGLSQALTPTIVNALEEQAAKPAVIWLNGQSCTGCVESFVNNLEPTAVDLLLDTISLRYNETVMAGSGYQAEDALAQTIAKGGYVLVVDGAIPLAENGKYCTIGGQTFVDQFKAAAKNAAVIVAAGVCSSFGGIPRFGPTGGVGILYNGTTPHNTFADIKTPVINLPTCPVHNERLVATLVYYLTFGKAPDLDSFHRPLAFYGKLQHDNCARRGQFEARRFVTNFNDPKQQGYCLILKGCKGPIAFQDCWERLWNNRASYCIQSSFPCVACSQPEFFEKGNMLLAHDFNFGV